MAELTKERPGRTQKIDRCKLPLAANAKVFKGFAAAGIIAAGATRGYVTKGAAAAGLLALGRFGESVDNTGGANGAKSAEVILPREIQVIWWDNDTDTPVTAADRFSRCYFVNAHTVTSDPTGSSIAGVVWGIEGNFVLVVPASVADDLDAFDAADIALTDAGGNFASSDVEGALAELGDRNGVLSTGYVHIPLTSFVDADGDPLAKFTSEGSPSFGFNLADSEALCIRWNNDATPGTALCQVSLPDDLDAEEDVILEFLVSKSGATVGDATILVVTAFLIAPTNLHDADSNAGGETAALTGNAAAKTTTALTRTIAAADVPTGARSMTFTVTPKAGTLGTDDLLLHSVRLKYTRKAA